MNKLYNDTAVQAIANAIRAKNGGSDAYTIAEMSTALNDISYYAKPTISNVQLATFEADGLPLNSLKVSVEAKQDLHGYDKPWVGGAGKNKCPMTVDNIKALNTTGTWSGNSYTQTGVTFTIQTDADGNVVGIATSGTSSNYIYFTLTYVDAEIGMIINGAPTGGDRYKWFQAIDTTSDFDYGNGTTISKSVTNKKFMIVVANGVNMSNKTFYPMIRLATESDATFAPYSNICPISGWDNATVTDTDDVDNPTVTQTATISLGQTVYGGEVDVVNGVLKITDGYIASYNGETLPSKWISSMDVYAEGTTPTTGAEVCYELAEPIIINLTPSLIKSLNGINNLSVDCGDVIELEYFKEV